MRSFVVVAMLVLAAPAAAATARPASPARSELYSLLSERVAATYDSARGGFVDRRGVPSDAAVELALRHAADSKGSPWRARGLRTITWTRGLHDTAGGGYHHSASSADPLSPDFEKRTDSNARRLVNLLLAWRVTGDATHRTEAARVADFLHRVPFDARGGFAAGQFGHGEMIPEINGIAAHAWFEWAAATRDPQRRDEALATLDRLWNDRWVDGYGFMRADATGKPAPLLADQVEMGRAFVLGASVCGRPVDRKRAVAIGNLLLERFADDDKGGFRTRSLKKKDGSIAGARVHAHENARAARFLCELAGLTGDERYRHAAGRAWLRFADENEKPNLGAAEWALAVRAAVNPALTGAPKWERIANNEPAPPRSIRIGRSRGGR